MSVFTSGAFARLVLTAMLASLSTACTFGGPASGVATTYDLGAQPAYAKSNPALAGSVLIPPVVAPAWLDGNVIVYRLLYEDSARPQAYAMSRWAADPASLVTDRLRSRFSAVSHGVVSPSYGSNSDYTLRVELEDFSQRFDAPGQSRTTLRARASLLSTPDRKLLAQRVFDVERPAAGTAPGAVKALTESTDAFLEDLVKWTAENARPRIELQSTPTAAGR